MKSLRLLGPPAHQGANLGKIDCEIGGARACGEELISTYLTHVKRRTFLRDDADGTRHLPVSAPAAGGPRRRAAIRPGAAPARPDKRPVFAADGADPSGAANDRQCRGAARDGPHDLDRQSEAPRTARAGRGANRQHRPAQPPPRSDSGWPGAAGRGAARMAERASGYRAIAGWLRRRRAARRVAGAFLTLRRLLDSRSIRPASQSRIGV